jgi:ribosome-binding factor A
MSRRKSRRRPTPKQTTRNEPVVRPQRRPSNRKTLQLCEQVREALGWVIGSAIGDERLALCQVQSVEPLARGNRLLVKVAVPPELSVAEVVDRLAAVAPVLRAEVAQSITRRKVPELVYTAVPAVDSSGETRLGS